MREDSSKFKANIPTEHNAIVDKDDQEDQDDQEDSVNG